MKIRPVGAELFHADRQYEANNHFPQFSERAQRRRKPTPSSGFDTAVSAFELMQAAQPPESATQL